jgi:hypothetical protein
VSLEPACHAPTLHAAAQRGALDALRFASSAPQRTARVAVSVSLVSLRALPSLKSTSHALTEMLVARSRPACELLQ